MTLSPAAIRATREELLLRLLFRMTQTMNADMAERIRARGFSDFQPSFTALLANLDTEGTRVGAIARRMGTTRQAVSQLLQAIEARGYVERIADADDKRAVIARHTPSGRKLLTTAIEVMLSIENEYAEAIGGESLARLKRLMKKLVDRVDPKGSLGLE